MGSGKLGSELNIIIGSKGYIGSSLATHFRLTGIEFIEISSRDNFFTEIESIDISTSEVICVYWCAATFLPNSKTPNIYSDSAYFELLVKKLSPYRNKAFILMLSSAGLFEYEDQIHSVNRFGSTLEYFQSKFLLENIYKKSKFDGSILRVANVYGPRVDHQFGVVASWIRSLKAGEPVLISDSLQSARDYIHIDDLLSAITYACKSRQFGTFYVGTGIQTSLGDLAKIFESFTKVEFKFSKEEKFESKEIRKISRPAAVNWCPMRAIESGIRATLISEGIL